jgi:chromosomal replication initiation ATPase DnaA
MSYNSEEKSKQYVLTLPAEVRNNTEVLFLIYEAYIAGHKEASTPRSKDMIFDNTYEEIINIVCLHYNTTFHEINTKGRKRDKVFVRQVCMYFADKYTDLTQAKIASKFGMDHVTMIHAKKVINNFLATDKTVITDIRVLEMKIKRMFLT